MLSSQVKEDPLECNLLFSRLFQNLQVRSTTEAMAETVGSIMNQHLGKKTGDFAFTFFIVYFNLKFGAEAPITGILE